MKKVENWCSSPKVTSSAKSPPKSMLLAVATSTLPCIFHMPPGLHLLRCDYLPHPLHHRFHEDKTVAYSSLHIYQFLTYTRYSKILHRIYRKLVFLSAYIHLTINSSLLCCIFRIMYQLHCQSFINSVSIWALKGTDLNSMKTLAQLPEKEKVNQGRAGFCPRALCFPLVL